MRNTKSTNAQTEITGTPYDDVFRTLLNDCSELVIPLINEVFGTHYTGSEKVTFSPNEHFLNQYDTQIALDDGELKDDVLTVTFPCSALLLLRHPKSSPDRLKIRMITPGGTVEYDIHVIKSQTYTLEEIFKKNLLLLLPFYIFTHEKMFARYEEDSAGLTALQKEYARIREHLEKLTAKGIISEYTQCTIADMSGKVLEHIAKEHDSVREGVETVMGGKVLEYEAKTILKRGIAQGEKQGFTRGREQGLEQGIPQGGELKLIQLVQKKLKKNKTEEQIAEDLEETIENITQICNAIQYCKSENPKEIYQTLKACQQSAASAEGTL